MQPPVQTGDVYQGELDNDNAGLGRVLFEKVAQAASLAWKRCYAAKTEITHKTLSPLKNIHQKLVGLTFVEPKVAPVAELIAMAMQEIPRRGAIRGGMLTRLQSLVCMLCDPNLMQSHGQRMLEGKTGAGGILDGLLEPSIDVLPETLDLEEGNTEEADPPILQSRGLW